TIARHHRDRVVRTLGRAVEAADAGQRVDIHLALRIAKDGARWTTGQALRIFAVHTDRRHQHVLLRVLAQLNRTLDVNSASQQTRLAVDFVTGERAIAATYAQVHVNDQQIDSIDDARSDLFFRRGQLILILWDRQTRIIVSVGQPREYFRQPLGELRFGLQTLKRDFQQL